MPDNKMSKEGSYWAVNRQFRQTGGRKWKLTLLILAILGLAESS
jgi:hypothetical protein